MTHLLRREMLALLGAAAVAGPGQAKVLPYAGASRLTGTAGGLSARHLWIRQAGGGDELFTRIRTPEGHVDRAAVRALAWLFRDWRDGDAAARVDLRLFELLAALQASLSAVHGRALRITLTSGYRTPRRNATIEGAAPNSQHIHGRAADLTVAGVHPADVAEAAEIFGAPGLGRYRSFTHVDVGPAGRRW